MTVIERQKSKKRVLSTVGNLKGPPLHRELFAWKFPVATDRRE